MKNFLTNLLDFLSCQVNKRQDTVTVRGDSELSKGNIFDKELEMEAESISDHLTGYQFLYITTYCWMMAGIEEKILWVVSPVTMNSDRNTSE